MFGDLQQHPTVHALHAGVVVHRVCRLYSLTIFCSFQRRRTRFASSRVVVVCGPSILAHVEVFRRACHRSASKRWSCRQTVTRGKQTFYINTDRVIMKVNVFGLWVRLFVLVRLSKYSKEVDHELAKACRVAKDHYTGKAIVNIDSKHKDIMKSALALITHVKIAKNEFAQALNSMNESIGGVTPALRNRFLMDNLTKEEETLLELTIQKLSGDGSTLGKACQNFITFMDQFEKKVEDQA
ncbi:hypothetical protein K491DRAFT_683130 [Lophiostoma macrostomum CBS 122681]|uniref:Uncharacterized protein n=1 Tax=Lophiostoma macrostomum CBS 122681 TaxID=1314788 RepID=A0A6A6STH4_9PLEO|nr:hypothetical protein K491DRAFT_683130 [Lophiostoma macrostomum CBS 122681]